MSEAQAAKQMLEYELLAKLDKITQRAFEGTTKAPLKPLSVVDQEVIREYQKQFNQPVREYEMELDLESGELSIKLDEAGKPIYRIEKKYHTIAKPDLEVLDYNDLEQMPNEWQMERIHEELADLPKMIETHKKALLHLMEIRKKAVDMINELPSVEVSIPVRPTDISGITERSSKNKKKSGEREEIIQTTRQRMEAGLQVIDNKIDEVKDKINVEDDNYKGLILALHDLPSKMAENEAKKKIVEQTNLQRIKGYQDTLNLLNKGAFQHDKLPTESEQEYLDRVHQQAEQEYVDDTKDEADLFAKKQFKDNMKQLIRDEVKLELIVNSFDIEVKNKINKQFPRFKKKFIELYGINNPAVKVEDVITFIKVFDTSVTSEKSLSQYIKSENISEDVPEVKKENDKNKVYTITNPNNNRKVFFRVAESMEQNHELYLLYSFSGNRHSFREFKATNSLLDPEEEAKGITNSYDMIKHAVNLNKTALNSFFDKKKYSDKWIYILLKHIETTTDMDPEPAIYAPAFEYEGELYQPTMGWGIKSEEVPETVKFGKIIIALHNLFFKNVLSARHHNNARIAGFPNIKVSDDFVKLIMKLSKGEKVIKQEIDALSSHEQQVYDRLLQLAHLHKSHPLSGETNENKTVTALKTRMQILEGEMESGNTNPLLKKELYNIVHSLKSFGIITHSEMMKYLTQF